ncbi:MAG: carboxypeptidase-like regulatory domain-containing protein [Alphaproteobacteria bacterium]
MKGLVRRAKEILSLARVQAILGIVAATLSIGGFLYGYLRPAKPPSMGELILVVQDAKTSKAIPDATIEVLTGKDALVATLTPTGGRATQALKEGHYRLRVSHPKFATEARQVQVLAGQNQEIQLRLTPRAAASGGGAPSGGALEGAGRAVDEGVEKVKKIFR